MDREETWYQMQGRMAHETIDRFAENQRMLEAWADTLYQKWLTEAVFAAAIKLPWQAEVTFIVNYNPQKLLPSPETIRPLTTREWTSLYMRLFDFPKGWLDDTLDLTRLREPTFSHIDFKSLYEPIPVLAPGEEIVTRRLAPFVSPTGRRWYEPDATPLEDIKSFIANFDVPVQHKIAIIPIDSDFGMAEARVLASMMHDKRVRGIILDAEIDGAIEGRRLFPISDDIFTRKPVEPPPEVSTASGKRDMSYLKHDRTKQHRRRRR